MYIDGRIFLEPLIHAAKFKSDQPSKHSCNLLVILKSDHTVGDTRWLGRPFGVRHTQSEDTGTNRAIRSLDGRCYTDRAVLKSCFGHIELRVSIMLPDVNCRRRVNNVVVIE